MGNIRGEKQIDRLNTDVSKDQNLIRKTYKQVFLSSYYFYIDIISKKTQLTKSKWIE